MSEYFSIICPECHQLCLVQAGQGMQLVHCSLCGHEWMEPEWVTTVRGLTWETGYKAGWNAAKEFGEYVPRTEHDRAMHQAMDTNAAQAQQLRDAKQKASAAERTVAELRDNITRLVADRDRLNVTLGAIHRLLGLPPCSEAELLNAVRKGREAERELKGELKDIIAQREMLLGFLHDIRKATGVYMFGSALVAGLKEMREQHDQQFQELVETTKERDVLRTENEILKEGTFYCAPLAVPSHWVQSEQELKEKLDRVIKDRAKIDQKLNDLRIQLSKVLEPETPSDGSLIWAGVHLRNQRIALEQEVKRAGQSLVAAHEEQDRLIAAKNSLRDSLCVIAEAVGLLRSEYKDHDAIMARFEKLKGMQGERNELRKELTALRHEVAELRKEREARMAEAKCGKKNTAYLNDIRAVLGVHKFAEDLVAVVAELKEERDTQRKKLAITEEKLTLARQVPDAIRAVTGLHRFGPSLVEAVAELKKKLDSAIETNAAYETVRAQLWRVLGTNWGQSIVKAAETVVAERDRLRKEHGALQQRIADAPVKTVFVTFDSCTLIHGYDFNEGDRVALVLMKEAGE